MASIAIITSTIGSTTLDKTTYSYSYSTSYSLRTVSVSGATTVFTAETYLYTYTHIGHSTATVPITSLVTRTYSPVTIPTPTSRAQTSSSLNTSYTSGAKKSSHTITSSQTARTSQASPTSLTANGSPKSATGSKHLSTGAIAGIAVGTATAIIIILAVLIICIRWKKRAPTLDNTFIQPATHPGTHELSHGEDDPMYTPVLPSAAGHSMSRFNEPELVANSSLLHSDSYYSNREKRPIVSNTIVHDSAHEGLSASTSDATNSHGSEKLLTGEKEVFLSENQDFSYHEVISSHQQMQTNNLSSMSPHNVSSLGPVQFPVNEEISPKYFVSPQPQFHAQPQPQRPGPYTYRAYSRQAAEQSEAPDKLERLRAEHEALMLRIQRAKDREKKRNSRDLRQ